MIHKLGYLYTELKEYEKANYYINWINEFASKQDNKISNLLKKISDSLTIKLKDPNYLCNKNTKKILSLFFKIAKIYFRMDFKNFI